MNKLERKLGRFAIPNLYIGIIGCFVIGYIFRYLATDIYNYLDTDTIFNYCTGPVLAPLYLDFYSTF